MGGQTRGSLYEPSMNDLKQWHMHVGGFCGEVLGTWRMRK